MGRPADRRDYIPVAAFVGLSLSRLTLLLFLAFQAADGLMTYGAASVFGTAAEGNPIIATWMQLLGVGPTLVLAKLASSAGGILLYWRGVHLALAGVTAFYAFGAVIPWLTVLAAGAW
jgi:Na+/melibiose symporter-like transporter